MTTHTPGPWRESWIRPDARRGHTFDPTCAILADLPEGTIRLADIPDPVTPEEEANARLIAAAPALLAALEAILTDGGYDDDGDFILYHVDGGREDHEDPPALIQARAALRAALGDGPVRAQEAQERASDQERAR